MAVNKRLLELEADLELTRNLYIKYKHTMLRQALNNLRYLLIKEKNLLGEGWDEL